MEIGITILLGFIGFGLSPYLAKRLGLIDVPGEHKQHATPTPVIGGLIVWLVVILQTYTSIQYALVIALIILITTGAYDDRYQTNWFVRILAQSLASLILVYSGAKLSYLGNFLGIGPIYLYGFGAGVTYIAFMSLINGHNMLDGIDGLFAGIGITQLLCLLWLAIPFNPAIVDIQLPVIIMLSLFLCWNISISKPASLFFGDQGTYALGLWNTYWAIILSQYEGVTPVMMLWVMMWPLFEMLFSLLRRCHQSKLPTLADRLHLHHLLHANHASSYVVLFYVTTQFIGFFIGLSACKVSEGFSFMCFLAFFGAYVKLWNTLYANRTKPNLASSHF